MHFLPHTSCCIVVLACVQNPSHSTQCAVPFRFSSSRLGHRRPTCCCPCFVFVGLFSFATHTCLFFLRLCHITLAIPPSLLLSINALRRKNGVLVFSKPSSCDQRLRVKRGVYYGFRLASVDGTVQGSHGNDDQYYSTAPYCISSVLRSSSSLSFALTNDLASAIRSRYLG